MEIPMHKESFHLPTCVQTPKSLFCCNIGLIWYYEHIITGRPKLLDGTSTFPRVCRWESTRQYQTIKFEQLEHTQIVWKVQPTSVEMEINIVMAIAQESYVRTAPGTIEQPIEIGSEIITRMVRVQREEEEPILQDQSTIFVLSDDEESKVIDNLRREVTELKGIIEEERKEKKVMKKLQDDNKELWKRRVQQKIEELMKNIQDEEELKKIAQQKIEELTKRFQDEEELRKRVQFQYDELIKRVHNEEELRKIAQHDIEELEKRVHDVELLDAKQNAVEHALESSCYLAKFLENQQNTKETLSMINKLATENGAMKSKEVALINERDMLKGSYLVLEKQLETDTIKMKKEVEELEFMILEIQGTVDEELKQTGLDLVEIKSQFQSSNKLQRTMCEEIWSEIIAKDWAMSVLHHGLNTEKSLLYHGLCESNSLVSQLKEHNGNSRKELEACSLLRGKLLSDIRHIRQ